MTENFTSFPEKPAPATAVLIRIFYFAYSWKIAVSEKIANRAVF